MDLLDKYKETWKNQPDESHRLSKLDIYKLTHKKSSSIVKWIFIVGILELVFITVLSLALSFYPKYDKYAENLKAYYIITDIVSYAVIIYFLVLFYKNHVSISASDSTKVLMSKILQTRKTLKNYFIANLGLGLFFSIYPILYGESLKEDHSYIALFISFLIAIPLVSLMYWLYYQLLYGIFLKKLGRNYNELIKLDGAD